ncbi:SDR family NAD(P)-dependent oxidoreductase [Agrobacterium vitis]|uniref:SDR family oxidoreductase n=1 Tax=Agrobacterium vitis TaxID=373 RepID=UPI0012E782FD|nr:SDR family oxidoreductase [Agrobacterium vitis]MVA22053.1 SDR family NAD(P)-dependent oxidoreductase [Agrobacterium vitis]
MPTVFITGCSTGFGRETALYFIDKGWTVFASMRNPDANTMPVSERLHVLQLDVTDAYSIADAIAKAGQIDVLVNNAGIGWFNALEGTPLNTAREVFDTNLFGAIAMMQAVLPAMRERRSGTIVNVSSSTIYTPIPLLAVYRASKAAVTAMTEAAAGELAQFNITARVVVPGLAPATSFAANIGERVAKGGWFPPAYADYAQNALAHLQSHPPEQVTTASDVAEAIFRSATDPDCPAVLPAGPDAIAASLER